MLIDEMCDRENTKRDRSSAVARLMGMNALIPKAGPTIQAKECFDENPWKHTPKMSNCETSEVNLSSLLSGAAKSPLNHKQQLSIPLAKSLSSAKSYRREHPQEEQLQKFKKEFEAWQESKLWEFSSNLGHHSSEELKNEQIPATENLRKEKMAAHTNTCLMQMMPVETDGFVSFSELKVNQNRLNGFQNYGNDGEQLMPKIEDDMAIRRELKANSFEPTRIVILKPGSDMNDVMEEPWGGSPEVVKKGSSMEDFLEEVKKRLRLEMEGKGRNESFKGMRVGRTSLHESSTYPKQVAWEAAKHGAMLRRSQSMITCRSAFHFDGQESSKSIQRERKKIIYDRLKNVLKDDTDMKKHMLEDEMFGNSFSVNEKARSKPVTPFSKEGKDASFWEHKKVVNETIPKLLRHGKMKMVPLGDETMSPSNLDKSFSASASGSTFENAHLADRCIATEAQIFQKHEASKVDSAVVKKRKKDGFSIKSTVSNLKRNLGLRGKFFEKVSPREGSTVDTVHYVNPMNETTALVIRNFGIVQDNSTEVPPSPASFPCSPINEHYSPVTPLEDPFGDGYSSTQASGELSMSLLEFGRLTEHDESERCGMAIQTRFYDSNETILTEGCGEAYVRDILVVSGWYRASSPLDQAISRVDGQIKPISSCVFDEVEKKCRKIRTVDNDCSTMSLGDIDMDRKMLFDLVNEALSSVLDSSMTHFMSKRSTHCLTQVPHGRKLLDDLLNQIQIYSNPKLDQPQSIDNMVVWDVKLMPLLNASNEDISSLGGEVEWVIMRELIDDLLSDLLV